MEWLKKLAELWDHRLRLGSISLNWWRHNGRKSDISECHQGKTEMHANNSYNTHRFPLHLRSKTTLAKWKRRRAMHLTLLLLSDGRTAAPKNASLIYGYLGVAYSATFYLKVTTKSGQNFTKFISKAEERIVKTSLTPLWEKRTTYGLWNLWPLRDPWSDSLGESESRSVVSNSLRPHGLSLEFSRPESWSG